MMMPVPMMARFLLYRLLCFRAMLMILFLTRKRQVIDRVMYVFMIRSEPNEKKTGPSAYIKGEKSSELPLICIPHIYDIRNRRVRVDITTAYTFNVRCPARNITVAKANRITATHLSIELSKNGVAWLESYRILKSGFPSSSTAEPPLSVSGRTEYFPESLS